MKQTNVHLIDSLLYCCLFIAPTPFNANASSSGNFHSVHAKLHKYVYAVSVVLKKAFTFFFRIVKTLKYYNCLSYNVGRVA